MFYKGNRMFMNSFVNRLFIEQQESQQAQRHDAAYHERWPVVPVRESCECEESAEGDGYTLADPEKLGHVVSSELKNAST